MAVKIKNHRLLELLHCLLGTEDRLAQRMIFPEILGEDLMNQIVRAVLIHLDFFQNHTAFTSNVRPIEHRIEDQVAEYIHSNGQMIVKHLYVETNALLGGEGIHVAADRIHLSGNFLSGAMLGSLENHVLNEM